MQLTNPHRTYFTAAALGTMISIGMWEGSKGVILPHFLADLSLRGTTGAAIFAASAVGFCVGALSFGFVTQRFGLKRVFATGFLLCAINIGLFVTFRNPAFLYACMALFGTGMACLDLTASLPVSILYGERQGGMLSLLHGFFGIGTLVGPLAVVFLLNLGTGWRLPLVLIVLLYAIWVAWFLSLPALQMPGPDQSQGSRRGLKPLMRDALVWVATLTLAASVAVEIGLAMWLPTYFQVAKGLPEVQSAFYTTIFFAGFTVTRLAGTIIVDRVGYTLSVVLLSLVGAFGLGALMLLPTTWAWVSFFAGAGVAIVFPTCVALVAVRYPDLVNQAYTLMYSTAALAMIIVAPMMGWVGERAGLQAAMWLPLACFGLVAALMAYYGWRVGLANRAIPAGSDTE